MAFIKKIRMFWSEYWVRILTIGGTILLIILSVWGLSSLESFYLHMTLATLPLQLIMVAMNALIFVYFYMTVFRGGFSKLEKISIKSQDVTVKFSDVIGIDEAKEEAWEVVELIKDRARLKTIGGKILRGILMSGPPGCGKTYLAKAIAAEAGIPFLSMPASGFTEIFVGVGSSRVRKLFKKARRLAYGYGGCIVFIDELDAIGRGRHFSFFGGGEETNTTQNQLLVEMDGLGDKDENVIVIGASNAPEEVFDKALLRPGRFDRKIYIDRPGLEGREKLFKYYLGKVKYDPSIDIARLARKSVYKTPADISNLVKEAALIATRNKKDVIGYKEITEAMERIDMGIKHRRKMTETERAMVAYHETGHLLVMYFLHPTDDVFKASIISRRDTLGVVYSQPREELFTQSREELLADIKVALGGYVAEKIKVGTTSTGVISDFQAATRLAHNMIWRLGMGGDGFLGDYSAIPEAQLSEKMKETLNAKTNEILNACVQDVERLLRDESALFDRFAKELLEKEELEYDEIEAIFAEYGKSRKQIQPSA